MAFRSFLGIFLLLYLLLFFSRSAVIEKGVKKRNVLSRIKIINFYERHILSEKEDHCNSFKRI